MADKEGAKQEIKKLLDRYNKVIEEKRIDKYNEETTKKDLILPLFRALGWDVEDSNEVTAEEKISKKRVDYGFRINGIPKFFLEAKSLKGDLDNEKFAEQAINYSWHKGCTWAILTNFETLRVYNSEVKAANPWQSNLKSIQCNEFLDRFSELWLLSRESFEQGLLDKEAEKWGKKAKKSSVDKQLLDDFTTFRELLSKNITKLNQGKGLNEEDLDESVQRILDRLIFIRNCEDRELEEKILISNFREWESGGRGQLIKKLRETFGYFDKQYNSKIFANHLCDALEIDNEVLHEIIEGLYYTKDRSIYYDFSAIEADVLGNIYEQYIGHILKKTDKRATITEAHAHRKEQGIYYTPTYIVDYIVRNTLGELLKDKKVNADKLRVLDPACGSGSFLIKTFDVLNEYYAKHDKNYNQTQLDINGGGATYTRKLKIMQNNIFGVDLDKQAVEVAQLNLLLKMAEKGHRLPLLQENIKRGNSLIDDESVAGDKAFKWGREFKQIMDEGGFDVTVGNPPYVRQEELLPIKKYLEAHYETFHSMADLFSYFFERELTLLKDGGYFGMIVSNKWLKAGYGLKLRKFLQQYWIEQFIDFGDLQVFQDATTYPCIIIIRKIRKQNPKVSVCNIKTLNFESLGSYIKQNKFTINQKDIDENGWNFQDSNNAKIFEKIKKVSIPLKEYVGKEVYRGVLTGFNKAFVIDEKTKAELIRKDKKSAEIIKPFLTGNEVRKYGIDQKGKYLIFTRRGIDIDAYQAIKEHLEQFKSELTPKKSSAQSVGRKPGDYKWYEIQDVIAYHREFDKPKIIYGKIITRPRFTIDTRGFFVNDSNFFFPIVDKKLLAILNSKLGWFLIQNICTQIRGGYQLIWKYFGNVPIAKEKSPELEKLVDKMLSLNKRLSDLGDKKTDERARIEEEIKKTDAEIDELVYKIYGITDEEKKIIEASLK